MAAQIGYISKRQFYLVIETSEVRKDPTNRFLIFKNLVHTEVIYTILNRKVYYPGRKFKV